MPTPRADTYTAGSGATMAGGRVTLPAWLSGAVANQWVSVPGGQPSTASGLAPAVAGAMGTQSGMVNAWGGGFARGAKFYIHGGGHADYGGNEVGVIDLEAASPAWDVAVERTPVASLLGGANYYADGLPTSRHTYYAMHVLDVGGVPKMLRFNGWMGFAYNGTPVGGAADVRTVDVDAFNLVTNQWEPAAYGPVTAITGSETTTAIDAATGDVYAWHGSGGTIQKYTAASDTCAQVASSTGVTGAGAAAAFDSSTGRLWRFAGRAGHRCTYWTSGGGVVTPTLIGPAASVISSLTGDNQGWGIAHDPVRRVVWLITSTAVLLRVRLADGYVEQITTTGVSATSPTNGTWGRLQYLPRLDALVYLANWTSPLLALRCA